MSKYLDEIIKKLGYYNSPQLLYKNDYNSIPITAHVSKVLNELLPYAVYFVEKKPFVLFFEDSSDLDENKIIHKKIWNAQMPIAIFCGVATVRVFSGYTIDKKTHLLPGVKELKLSEVKDDSPFSFWEITNQEFWKDYASSFNGKKLNDVLLDNLTYLTERLKKTHKIKFATKLVLRFIFIRYLIDRGVDLDYPGFSSDVDISREALLSILCDEVSLYALFAHLKKRFNGNLFEYGDEKPNESLSPAALSEIKGFLSANIVLPRGQYSLFALYDFNLIPVELISNIYEVLLGNETRNKDNAFYTPKYLVDYILNMTIDEHLNENKTCKILDPSCGSGIFLVDGYRRMVEKELNGALFTDDDDLLRNILKDNIFGIDRNDGAIDVAIFSLYIAMLDYKNPKTLERFRLPDLKNSNLLVCDFFDEEKAAPLQKKTFDYILGNPPWSDKPGLHIDYCEKYDHLDLIQDNDTCRSFVLRSKDFSEIKKTKCCFVLHSKKMFYLQGTQSENLRKFLLNELEIINIIELSSVRKQIFNGAVAPAAVFSYMFSDEDATENRFNHIAMKPNIFFSLFKIIAVEKVDVKSVKQRLLLENDWAWKALVYGLAGDIDNIIRIKSSLPTVGQILSTEDPKIIKSTGVQYHDGDKKDASHLVGKDFLQSDAIDHFYLDSSMIDKGRFAKSSIHRPKPEEYFRAPYCLVKKGLDLDEYTMRAVYSEIDFVYQETVYAIKGSFAQRNLLLNMTGLLNSKAYSYFNLILGSSLGIEREQRFTREILKFPYAYSDSVAAQVERIQEIKKKEEVLFVDADASEEIDALNHTVLEAFGLSDNEFVDYALRIQIPQLTGVNNNDATRKADVSDFMVYAKCLYRYLTAIFETTEKHIKINVYPTVINHYSAIEVVVCDSQPEEWLTTVDSSHANLLPILTKFSAHRINELFYTIKDVIYFEENSFYLIKTSYYKNWHPAIAKLDLAEVTDQILSGKTGGDN